MSLSHPPSSACLLRRAGSPVALRLGLGWQTPRAKAERVPAGALRLSVPGPFKDRGVCVTEGKTLPPDDLEGSPSSGMMPVKQWEGGWLGAQANASLTPPGWLSQYQPVLCPTRERQEGFLQPPRPCGSQLGARGWIPRVCSNLRNVPSPNTWMPGLGPESLTIHPIPLPGQVSSFLLLLPGSLPDMLAGVRRPVVPPFALELPGDVSNRGSGRAVSKVQIPPASSASHDAGPGLNITSPPGTPSHKHAGRAMPTPWQSTNVMSLKFSKGGDCR